MITTEPAIFRPNIRCRNGGSPEPYSPTSLERMRDIMRFYNVDSVAPRMLATIDHERSALLGLVQRLAGRLGPDEQAEVAAEVDHELSVFRRVGVELEVMEAGR